MCSYKGLHLASVQLLHAYVLSRSPVPLSSVHAAAMDKVQAIATYHAASCILCLKEKASSLEHLGFHNNDAAALLFPFNME